ncbi:MAG: ABC transporter permease [Vicinamibacterales bacterium]
MAAASSSLGTAGRQVLAAAAVLAAWEIAARAAGLPQYVLPAPSVVAQKLWETRGLQAEHLAVTGAATLSGLVVAIVAGVGLALVAVYVETVGALLLPALAAFNGIPKVAIAPLFVIWFGLGDLPKVLLAALMGLFPVFVAASTGLGVIDRDYLDLARLAGGGPWRLFTKVRLPHALPHLIDALKVAFPLALVGALVGEFIGGNRGIGYLILSAQGALDTPFVFACLASITLLTSLGTAAIVALERWLLAWRPARRG